jgi:hypothetical protein
MSTLGGEMRFASAIAARMQAMGALTQGDRRCAGQLGAEFQDFAIDPVAGVAAASETFRMLKRPSFVSMCDIAPPPLLEQACPEGSAATNDAIWHSFSRRNASNAFQRMTHTRDCTSTFFNCLMACTVRAQTEIFAVFAAFLEHFMLKAKRSGAIGGGILDVVGANITVEKTEVLSKCPETSVVTSLVQVSTDRGLDYAAAVQMLERHGSDAVSGFYTAKHQVDSFHFRVQC